MEFNRSDEIDDKESTASSKEPGDYIKLDFAAFILSISSSALVALGELPDPISKEKKKNITLAKQMIDVINMLRDKTKGNLTKEEEDLVNSLSSELKMKYVQAINL